MIALDVAGINEAARALTELPDGAERAASRALNRAAIAGRQVAVEAITERYAARTSDVRATITLSSATPKHPQAVIESRSSALPLGYFPHSPKRGGTGGRGAPPLTVEVLRGTPREVRGGFVANVSGGPRVFRRSGPRALVAIYSTPVARMMGQADVREVVEARAAEVFVDRLEHEMDREQGGRP